MNKNILISCFFKVLYLIILLGMSTCNCTAQLIDYYRWSQEEKESKSLELINEATYVVEAEVEDFKYFYSDDEKTRYTDLTLKVNHWYKGEGTDTIHIRRKISVAGKHSYGETSVSYPHLSMKQTYILLLKRDTSNGNYTFLRHAQHIVAISTYDDYYMVGFHGLFFDNAKEFNQFISHAHDMKIPVLPIDNQLIGYDHLSQEEKEIKSIELINNAEYLVEGKPIEYKRFYRSGGRTVYADYTIEVKHWYKGHGDKKIDVIAEKNNIKDKKSNAELEIILTDSQHVKPPIVKDTHYFMLLKKSKIGEKYEFINEYDVGFYGWYPTSLIQDFDIRAFCDLKFESMDDFETFISKAEGIKLSR